MLPLKGFFEWGRLKKLSFLFLFAAIVIALDFFFKNLKFALQLPFSLGDDSVIAVISPGRDLLQTFPNNFFRGLISSFRGEDHLFPLYYLSGLVMDSLFKDPEIALKVGTKFFHLSFLLASAYLVYRLWRSWWRTLVFVLFFNFNTNLNWRSLISLTGGLSPLFGMLVFLALLFEMDLKKTNFGARLWIFFLSFCMSFGLETAFSNLAFFAGFLLYFQLCVSQTSLQSRIQRLCTYGALFFLSFVPYFLLHYFLYQFPIPRPRNSSNSISLEILFSRLEAYVQFTLPKFAGWRDQELFYVVLLVIPPIFYFFRFGSPKGKAIYAGFLLNLFVILFTGRSEHGLWMFGGTLLLICYVDCLSPLGSRVLDALFKNKRDYKPELSLFVRCLLLLIGTISLQHCSRKTDSLNFHSFGFYRLLGEEQKAFSRTLAGPARVFSLYRLSSDVFLPGREAFWLANEIQNGFSGLKLISEQLMYVPMGFFVYTHNETISCNDLEEIQQTTGVLKGAPIVVKDKGGFQSYNPGSGIISRYVPIGYETSRAFQVCLPPLTAPNVTIEVIRPSSLVKEIKLKYLGETLKFVFNTSDSTKVVLEAPLRSRAIQLEVEGTVKPLEVVIHGSPEIIGKKTSPKARRMILKTLLTPCQVDVMNAVGNSMAMMIPAHSTIEYQEPTLPASDELMIESNPIQRIRPIKRLQTFKQNKDLAQENSEIFYPCENASSLEGGEKNLIKDQRPL